MMTTEEKPETFVTKRNAKKEILYVYVTEEIKSFVEETALKFDTTSSNVVNAIIKSYKTGTKIALEVKTPRFVKQYDAWNRRRRQARPRKTK